MKTSSSLPVAIDTRAQMKCRAARLKNFFTSQSQSAPCVTHSDIIPAMLWKSINNNNRATEKRIGKLKFSDELCSLVLLMQLSISTFRLEQSVKPGLGKLRPARPSYAAREHLQKYVFETFYSLRKMLEIWLLSLVRM